MSFATALLTTIGSVGRGLQQKRQNQQQADLYKSDQAYRQSEETRANQQAQQQSTVFQQGQQDRQANQGVDPSTGKPFVVPPAVMQALQRVRNGPNPQAPQHYYADLNTVYGWYNQTGQQNAAQNYGAQISDFQKSQAQQNTINAENAREDRRLRAQEILADQRSSAEDKRQAALFLHEDAAEAEREAHQDAEETQRENHQDHERTLPNYHDLHPLQSAINTVQGKRVSQYRNDFDTYWRRVTSVPTGKTQDAQGNPVSMPPLLTPYWQTQAKGAMDALDNSPNPAAMAKQILANAKKAGAPPEMTDLIQHYVKWRSAQNTLEQSESVPGGGSNGTGDPQYPGP